MPKNRLVWSPPNAADGGWQTIYKDTAEIDPDNPPGPLDVLPLQASGYDDYSVLEGVTYHYAIGVTVGGREVIGESFAITAQEPPPRFVNASGILGSNPVTSLTAQIPRPREGDVLVAYGFRRAPVATPAGWTDVGAPPDRTSGTQQWAYCFWKVSDGTEREVTVAYDPEVTEPMGLSVFVVRHDTQPINVVPLGRFRQPDGRINATALGNTAASTRGLVAVCFDWSATNTSGNSWVRKNTPDAWPATVTWTRVGYSGGLQCAAFLVDAQADQEIRIPFTASYSYTVSRSEIWLAFTI